jgi:nitroreductase
MKAGGLDVATRAKKVDLEAKQSDRRELEKLLSAWLSQGYVRTPDIVWAEERLRKFDRWLGQSQQMIINPVREDRLEGDLFSLIKGRRSVRLWNKKPVPKQLINEILEAGTYAPTAFNRMPWRFFVRTIPSGELKEPDASNQGMFDSAPVCIYVGVDDRLFFEKYSGPLDAACAMQNMLLMAHARGLGACLIYQGEFTDRQELEEKYQVPAYCTVYCAILIGYPEESPETPARMPVEEITTWIE